LYDKGGDIRQVTRDRMVNVNTSSISMSSDTGNSTDIKDWYEYRKMMQSQKNGVNKISNSSQLLIKEFNKLTSR